MALLSTTLLLALSGLASAPATPTEATTQKTGAKIGHVVADFELRDYRGKVHHLSDYKSDAAVVLIFVGTECPLVKAYVPRLEEIAKSYADKNVRFLAVCSNKQDNLTELAAFARLVELTLPILKDNDNKIADEVGAIRTPEVVLLDQERKIAYHGRIDDQMGVGYKRSKPNSTDLIAALDEVLAHKPVTRASTDAPGCHIGRSKQVAATGAVTYAKEIALIVRDKCQRCHRAGEIGPFPMETYEDVLAWSDTIAEVVDNGRMPPWFASAKHHGEFRDEATLTDEEKSLVRQWVANGCPEGNKNDLPKPITYADGWQIKPDQIWYMADKPFHVPAEGTIPYKHYVVDLGLTEDRWLQSTEARPGARSVVHHILIFLQEPGVIYPGMPGELISAYAPGFPPVVAPEKMAIRARKGSKILFQMHYTTNGYEQEDRSYFGVTYADPNNVTHRVLTDNAINISFKIPAGADNVPVVSHRKINKDVLLLGMNPHMHQRGKAYTYEAIYPDGTKEILLDVPRFDFNWQIPCMYHQPKLLPKGTKIVGTGIFDNSENNLSNPDPTKDVKWGDQTWEEMQIGWFTIAEELPPKKEQASAAPIK